MSSVNSDVPLSALAQSLMDNDVSPSPVPSRMDRMERMDRMDRMPVAEYMNDHAHAHAHHHDHAHHHKSKMSGWHFLFYFLVLVLVFYFLYFALRPYFVLKQDCDSRSQSSSDEWDSRDISQHRLLVAAILSALVLIFVLWLFSAVVSYTA